MERDNLSIEHNFASTVISPLEVDLINTIWAGSALLLDVFRALYAD
jgi:hypothetical protein